MLTRKTGWFLAFVAALTLYAFVERASLFSPACFETPIERATEQQQTKEHIRGCESAIAAGIVGIFGFVYDNREVINATSTLVIAAFTVILGVFTISLAGSTRIAANAARDSADIAKISMVASDRAYVHHHGIRWISHLNLNGDVFWRIRPSWINSGNTPTRQLRMIISYRLLDNRLPEDFDFPVDPQVAALPATLAPKGLIESAHYRISGTDLTAVRDGTKHFYVWGTARYRDVFPNTDEHVTKFCVYASDITGDPEVFWHEKDNPVGIVFTGHARHNCADDDYADA